MKTLGPFAVSLGAPCLSLLQRLAARAVPPGQGTASASLLKCGLQPFCSRWLRPEEGKFAHLHRYSNSWSLYFETTLSNVGKKQNMTVWEHKKTAVPTIVSFWIMLLGKQNERNWGFFGTMALRVKMSAGLRVHLWEKGAGLFGNRGFVGKVYLQPHLGSWGFTGNEETSSFQGPQSCPCWDLLFQGKVFGKEAGRSWPWTDCGEGQGFGMGWGWRQEG